MEDERKLLTAKEMAEQLQTKAAEIKQLQADLKKARKEAEEAKEACRGRINLMQYDFSKALEQLGASKIISARLKIIEDEMDLLRYAVGANPWDVETAEMIKKRLGGIVEMAERIAESARKNTKEF